MAIPANGIAHRTREPKRYTPEQIARKRDILTVDQCRDQLYRERLWLAKAQKDGHVKAQRSSMERLMLWLEILKEAELRDIAQRAAFEAEKQEK